MNGVKVMPAVFKREFVGEGMWKEANNVIPDSPPRVLLGISELRGGREGREAIYHHHSFSALIDN